MIKLNADELALLKEAAAHKFGEVRVKIAGAIHDPEQQEMRRVHASVLAHAGFLEEMPDQGAYAVWRIKPEAREALRRVME